MKFYTKNTKIRSTELHIPTQNSIEINQSPFDRLKLNDVDGINFNYNQMIRCKLITPKQASPSDVQLENCERLVIYLVSFILLVTNH